MCSVSWIPQDNKDRILRDDITLDFIFISPIPHLLFNGFMCIFKGFIFYNTFP